MPVSCTGMKPTGTEEYSFIVVTMVSTTTSSMNAECASAHPSVRA